MLNTSNATMPMPAERRLRICAAQNAPEPMAGSQTFRSRICSGVAMARADRVRIERSKTYAPRYMPPEACDALEWARTCSLNSFDRRS